ncbi:hypothetical protein TNCV_3909971 [Trichonephila clavipes]|nr:hypothetical protein TNCV_3909971 [Trichonephila clavipes]
MYKNALKEDLIRVVQELDGTVESTDTIVKLKTKIENSSTFESDPDFVKTLIQNCIDERVSQNEREILLWSPWKYRCGQRTIRLAVVACSQKQNTVFAAQAHQKFPMSKPTIYRQGALNSTNQVTAPGNFQGMRQMDLNSGLRLVLESVSIRSRCK